MIDILISNVNYFYCQRIQTIVNIHLRQSANSAIKKQWNSAIIL